VDESRWKTLLAYGWPISSTKRLTKDLNAAWLRVVAMGALTFDCLSSMKKERGGCQRVVAFQPTGWSHTGPSSAPEIGLLKPKRKDGNVIYSVPYSEHSSYAELVDFIRKFRCASLIIIP
jgi:DNA cross-link repair 1A protein